MFLREGIRTRLESVGVLSSARYERSFAGAEIALNTADESFRRCGFQCCARKDPRTVCQRMFAYDFTPFDSATQCNRTDAQKLCSSRQIHPMIRCFAAGFVARDLMFASQ